MIDWVRWKGPKSKWTKMADIVSSNRNCKVGIIYQSEYINKPPGFLLQEVCGWFRTAVVCEASTRGGRACLHFFSVEPSWRLEHIWKNTDLKKYTFLFIVCICILFSTSAVDLLCFTWGLRLKESISHLLYLSSLWPHPAPSCEPRPLSLAP